ncbi:MAG: GntR family transcriptional regulator [Anaerolineae bacterium]
MLPRYRSKKEMIYDFLKQEIIKGVHAPGSRLVIDDLAARLEVSQIPIREAIQQLEADGFITTEPYVGARITSMDATFIFEVFALLESHELICSRKACQSATEDDLKKLANMIAEMDGVVDDIDKWSEKNKAFHLYICDCARTPLVRKMMEKTFDHWDRLRLHYLKGMSEQRTHVAQQEHHQLLDAMRQRDVAQVEQLVHSHNQGALDSYIRHLESEGLLEANEEKILC